MRPSAGRRLQPRDEHVHRGLGEHFDGDEVHVGLLRHRHLQRDDAVQGAPEDLRGVLLPGGPGRVDVPALDAGRHRGAEELVRVLLGLRGERLRGDLPPSHEQVPVLRGVLDGELHVGAAQAPQAREGRELPRDQAELVGEDLEVADGQLGEERLLVREVGVDGGRAVLDALAEAPHGDAVDALLHEEVVVEPRPGQEAHRGRRGVGVHSHAAREGARQDAPHREHALQVRESGRLSIHGAGGIVAAGCGGGLLADVTVPVVDSGLSHRAMLYYSSCLSCLPEACYCRRQNYREREA